MCEISRIVHREQGDQGLTPEAVIFRYLEAANRQPMSVESFVRVLSADADLLGRWLNLLNVAADPGDLSTAIKTLSSERLHNLAQAQAWAVLPVAGSARLGLDQWQAVLRSAFLAEVLAEQLGFEDPVQVRWQILLAVSGVSLSNDRHLMELSAFRGVRPELLNDASALIKIFGVVDAFEVLDEYEAAQLAQSLLDVDAENFSELVEWAGTRSADLVRSLGLSEDREADWSNRLWVQQQVAMLSELLNVAESLEDIQSAHELIARSLFRQVPYLLVESGPGRYRATLDKDVEIHIESDSSHIARAIREGETQLLTDQTDLSVGDRQLLRRMNTEEALCIPMRHGDQNLGALLVTVDEDVDLEFALTLYTAALAQSLANLDVDSRGELELLKRYRQREEKRLRELVHEANNPLSVVQNYLHILEMRLQHETTATEQLSMIGVELKRATQIIQRARELSPITDLVTDAQVALAEFDINDLARRVHELHSGYAADHDVDMFLELTSDAVVVRSDEQRLAQILNNLVRNAIEAATGESVHIGGYVGVFREGREGIEIYVRDTGPGLPRAVLEQLADPKESSKGGDHAGLGLHIVHRLVGELGGNIDVRTSTGQGATFNLFLPLRPR
ncbi:MAG: sensor histidine kinase [Pseudomonadales bacterium]